MFWHDNAAATPAAAYYACFPQRFSVIELLQIMPHPSELLKCGMCTVGGMARSHASEAPPSTESNESNPVLRVTGLPLTATKETVAEAFPGRAFLLLCLFSIVSK